jgi:hypothetical protein
MPLEQRTVLGVGHRSYFVIVLLRAAIEEMLCGNFQGNPLFRGCCPLDGPSAEAMVRLRVNPVAAIYSAARGHPRRYLWFLDRARLQLFGRRALRRKCGMTSVANNRMLARTFFGSIPGSAIPSARCV